ncbi:DEAD/DEAH box helicase [Flavobacterium sp. JP2137]|uniref:DEAD/DEAH box helicase n=1 Tax=Flavobacterium sp. JP2137 TaxID=3414510 RepID=UPI003D2FF1E2
MKLKKINIELEEALVGLSLIEPTALQKESFSVIKSGVDTVIVAPTREGKSLALAISVIQKLEKAHLIATRALVVVKDKEAVLEMTELFEKLTKRMDLRVYGVHNNTDLDNDKNMLSIGNDILIGTMERLNNMFSSAGFDVNQLKMFVVDDLDQQLKLRLEPKFLRVSESVGKTQRVYFSTVVDERTESFVEKTMSEDAVWLQYE